MSFVPWNRVQKSTNGRRCSNAKWCLHAQKTAAFILRKPQPYCKSKHLAHCSLLHRQARCNAGSTLRVILSRFVHIWWNKWTNASAIRKSSTEHDVITAPRTKCTLQLDLPLKEQWPLDAKMSMRNPKMKSAPHGTVCMLQRYHFIRCLLEDTTACMLWA
jgi:hypothetical protein